MRLYSLIILTLAASALPAQRPVEHDSLMVDSRALHERRLINVHTPSGYRGRGQRYQVLYMPDGGMNEDFPHVVRAVDSLTAAGAISPTIVVGVPNTERRRDLTGPTRVHSDSAIAPHVGGSAAFRTFIRDELIPAIDARYRTNSTRAIIGESLAGLFIVETFLREPKMFNRYAAFDPSLWWNRGSLTDSSEALVAAMPRTLEPRRLFVASSRDGIDDRSTRLTDVLRQPNVSWIVLEAESHPELTHATIFAGLEVPALRYILSPPR